VKTLLRNWLWRWRWRLGLVAVLVVVFLVRSWWLPSVARFLDVSEAPAHTDYVMVLGGGAESRPFAAAALVRAGRADRVLLPHVALSPEAEAGTTLPEAEVTARVLRARGVADSAVEYLPSEVNSTADEARALAAFLRDHPDATVTVVTHRFHTRRARWIVRQAIGGPAPNVHFFGVPNDGFDESNWWQCEAGLGCYFNEYVKLCLYTVRYSASAD
jgi:uncharacterized SAM-binding protein YcdF (DUF218 family)